MDILTGARMRQIDEDTIARFCPGIELMERAGGAVADLILDAFPPEPFRAAIFVGPGNNGGDALVVARHLVEAGRACSLFYLSTPEKFTLDAAKNHQRLQPLMADPNLRLVNITRSDWLNIAGKELLSATLIVDGLFGTGLTRPLEGRAAELVTLINSTRLPVVSIDIPSGIHRDTGEVLAEAVRARYTVTMGYPKLGMLFHPGRDHVGELHVADLQFPEEVLQVHSLGIYLLDRHEAARRLPYRAPDVHKYRAGTVALVAGSRAYTGATLLAAEAALRSGCGMVYAAVPQSIRPVIQGGLREAVVVGLPESPEGTLVPTAIPVLAPYLEKAEVLALGPGVGRHPATGEFVRELVARTDKPLVLDADGIAAFDGQTDTIASRRGTTILTPHSGELRALTGSEIAIDPVARVEQTRELARRMGITLVHKGAPTVVATAEGDVWIPPEGDSSLATAGTGDILTGMIAGVIAQGATALDAVAVASFLHARSASSAARDHGVRGVVAGDLLRYAGPVMAELERSAISRMG